MDKLTKAELFHLVKEAISDKNLIKEMSSYNRVRDHIEGGHPFVIMSSDRHERSGAENKAMYQQLKQDFAAAGFPFTELKGGFKETTKTEVDPETGEEVETVLDDPIHVTENSLLVTTHGRGEELDDSTPSSLFDFAAEVAQKYNQEAFIFGESATTSRGKKVKIINAFDNTGNEIQDSWAGPWTSVETVSKDADFWSRASGKHFQLKENKKTSQPKSWIEAMMKSRKGLNW
jgi:hypothetical protein